jgi:AcrR family transcriptional regulator
MARSDERPPVIWTRLEREARGARQSLRYADIVTAAVDIADADGIEALSMRKVAGKLGAGTMSLYRYVTNRDELIDLMVDRVVGEEPLPTSSGNWRADLGELGRRDRRIALCHPWSVGLLLGRPRLGPAGLRHVEFLMAAVDNLGLTVDQMADVGATVAAFVHGFVQAELADTDALRRMGLTEQEWRERMGPYLAEVLGSGRYPYARRIIEEAEDYPDNDVVFERRLGYVLDGIASSLRLPPAPG